MKKLILGVLAVAALLPVIGHTQEPDYVSGTLAYAWDMDGEGVDDNQIVEAAGGVIVDNGTSVGGVNYTITAQPDSCRLLDMTISDTDMTAGTITVTGTGCLGEAKTCTWSDWTAGDDDGVKTLTCTDGKGAYYSNVAAITTGVMTGESNEYFLLGYAGTGSANAWPAYGRLEGPDANGEFWVNVFEGYAINLPITTSGALSTTVTSVSSNAAFTNVAVGDLLLIRLSGKVFERKVTARASANSITVNSAINIPATGVTFNYKKRFVTTNPLDNVWIPVQADETLLFRTNVLANANTGGVVQTLECTRKGAGWPTADWIVLCSAGGACTTTNTTATGTTAKYDDSVNLRLLPYTHCRMGFKFGTTDDADSPDENINLAFVIRKN